MQGLGFIGFRAWGLAECRTAVLVKNWSSGCYDLGSILLMMEVRRSI